jgi:hypothetical protein
VRERISERARDFRPVLADLKSYARNYPEWPAEKERRSIASYIPVGACRRFGPGIALTAGSDLQSLNVKPI